MSTSLQSHYWYSTNSHNTHYLNPVNSFVNFVTLLCSISWHYHNQNALVTPPPSQIQYHWNGITQHWFHHKWRVWALLLVMETGKTVWIQVQAQAKSQSTTQAPRLTWWNLIKTSQVITIMLIYPPVDNNFISRTWRVLVWYIYRWESLLGKNRWLVTDGPGEFWEISSWSSKLQENYWSL